MKKFIKTRLLLTTLLFVPLVSCHKEKDNKTEVFADVKVTKVEVASLTLDLSSKNLGVGEEFTVKATIAPENATNKDVTWSSTNPEVATVDANGKVKTISVGKTEIVAKSNNGKEVKCSINVWGLELRIRTEENVSEYDTFDVENIREQVFEYKIHHMNGVVDNDWTTIDFNTNYVKSELNSNNTGITLFFTIEEEVENEESKKYSGSYVLKFNQTVKNVRDIKPNTEPSIQEDSQKYFLRGTIAGSYYTDATNKADVSTPEILLKDINTDDVYGIRNFSTSTSMLGGYNKGDEVLIHINSETSWESGYLVETGLILNADSSKSINLKSFLLSPAADNYSLNMDISKSTTIDTRTKMEELFDTNAQRVSHLYKLFTIPAGNKYSCITWNSSSYSPALLFGVGYTSDEREGYTDYAYYDTNPPTRINKVIPEGSTEPTSYNRFGFFLHHKNSEALLGSEDAANRLVYPERYEEGYTGSTMIARNNSDETKSMTNNKNNLISSSKSVTVMFVGSNKSVNVSSLNISNSYHCTGVIILDSSWVR